MTALTEQPRLAFGGVAVRIATAPLTLLVLVSAAARTTAAWLRATPAYFPDEYMYAAFSRSLAAGHAPAVRGVPAHFLPLLQPLLTAPAWLLPDTEQAYRAAQAIDATAMSLAAVPVYLLARRVGLGPRFALAAAILSLTPPSLIYSSFIVSEPLAYPLALGAVAAGVHALDRPSGRSYGIFIALAALCMFTRMQFAVLIPCFALALAVVVARERRVREFARVHRFHLGLLLIGSAALLALGPARNTGYYPSFSFVPGFNAATAAHVAVADALVLAFAGGFVLVPGAVVGIVYGLIRPRHRTDLAFAALTLALTVGLLLEAVVYGHLDYVQERYLFYLVPLWTISFLLYAQRGWPRAALHLVAALALLVGALRLPLSGYTVRDRFEHSPFLFALRRLEQLLGGRSSASFAIVLFATVATIVVVVSIQLARRHAAAVALTIAAAATATASIGATSFDLQNTRAMYDNELGRHPTWVDDTHTGPSTMLLLPGSQGTEATLFWNTSIDRLALLPGASPSDSFAVEEAKVDRNGTVAVSGQPLRGDIVLATHGSTIALRDATILASSTGHLLAHPQGPLRLRLMMVGRDSDGWLEANGYIAIWPDTAGGAVTGSLVLPVRPPRGGGAVTLRFITGRNRREIVRRAPPGAVTRVTVPVCTRGPATIAYTAGPAGSVGDGRLVAATAGTPRFVQSAGC